MLSLYYLIHSNWKGYAKFVKNGYGQSKDISAAVPAALKRYLIMYKDQASEEKITFVTVLSSFLTKK